jgi:hypothetical protein
LRQREAAGGQLNFSCEKPIGFRKLHAGAGRFFDLEARVRIEVKGNAKFETADAPPPSRQGKALLAIAALLAAALFLVWMNRGFADYALRGWRWSETEGTVTDASTTSAPTIAFSTPDGAKHAFREDYIILCGSRRSFCFMRNFDPGQQVPVVYDPHAPQAAFVHDWALKSGVITWFLEAGAAILLALMMLALVKGNIRASVRLNAHGGADLNGGISER